MRRRRFPRHAGGRRPQSPPKPRSASEAARLFAGLEKRAGEFNASIRELILTYRTITDPEVRAKARQDLRDMGLDAIADALEVSANVD